MTDSTNEKRPVRKLTVKNFSVIKDAETVPLEFGKITVLIGCQASGKSLLCKLAYFFQKVTIELAERTIRDASDLDTFRLRVIDEFNHTWFPAFGTEPHAVVTYEDGPFSLRLARKNTSGYLTSGSGSAGLHLSSAIETAYSATLDELRAEREASGEVDFNRYAKELRQKLEDLQSRESDVYSFVPSTRSMFITPQIAVLGTSGRMDPVSARFSQDFSFDFEKRVPQAGLVHELTRWLDQESRRILRGEVQMRGSTPVFRSEDGRELPVSYLSSGSQELLPLVTCLREYVALSAAVYRSLELPQTLHRRLFYVEEPETSVFPSTQYDLIRVFVRLANEAKLDASWVITTHSPYVLSSFNNLIEAGQAGRSSHSLRDQVAKIVPEQYWIKDGDFKAYAIEDGQLKSILNESGFVEGNYLDQVSETIGDEFDRLIKLEYDHAKAS